MKLDREQAEAVEFLQEWARAGFPRRADQSFPTDFLTAMRRIMDLPPKESFSSRRLEQALAYAGPNADHIVPRHHHWTSHDATEARNFLARQEDL